MSNNLNDENDCTPLYFSAKYVMLEATNDLVERGAALNNNNKYGNTPLFIAALNSKL
jgi:ankyrin repeat protein